MTPSCHYPSVATRTLRRALGLLVVAVLAVGGSACSSDDDSGGASDVSTSTQARAVAPEIAAVADLPGGAVASLNEQGADPLPPLPDDDGAADRVRARLRGLGAAVRVAGDALRGQRLSRRNGSSPTSTTAPGFDIAGYAAGVDAGRSTRRSPSSAPSRCTSSATRAARPCRAVYLGDPAQRRQGREVRRDRRRAVSRRRALPRADAGDESRAGARRGRDVEGVVRRDSTSSCSATRRRSSTSCRSEPRSCSPGARSTSRPTPDGAARDLDDLGHRFRHRDARR